MENITPFKNGVKWGLILGVIGIVFNLVLYLAGMIDVAEPHPIAYLGFLFLLVVIVLSIKSFKEGNNGILSLGQALGTGVVTAIVGSIVGGIYTYVFFTFIDPALLEAGLETAMAKAQADQGLSDEQMEASKGMMSFFMSPTFFVIVGLVINLVVGFLVSLVTGLIMREGEFS